MTRNEALKKAEENLLAAEGTVRTISAATDRAEARTRIARGWISLAEALDRKS